MDGATVADWLRAELLNYDLAIRWALARIDRCNAAMNRCKGAKGAKRKARFIRAKAERERTEVFLADIQRARAGLLEGVEVAFRSYPSVYGKVFRLRFVEALNTADTARIAGISEGAVLAIVDKISADLLTFYRP